MKRYHPSFVPGFVAQTPEEWPWLSALASQSGTVNRMQPQKDPAAKRDLAPSRTGITCTCLLPAIPLARE